MDIKFDINHLLSDKRLILLDGGMGTMLINAGIAKDVTPESWNITNPEDIYNIHDQYYKAGSDIILTNTFGGTRVKLDTKEEGNKVEEYNKIAVSIAKKACPYGKFVAGDIGPTGEFLPPVGKATNELFFDSFKEQAKFLIDSKVDLLYVETMYDIEEAKEAIKAIKEIDDHIPVFTSITFKKTKKGFFTIMGDSVKKCMEELKQFGISAVGTNCTLTSNEMIPLISEIKIVLENLKWDIPIIAKPNAGNPELKDGKAIYPTNDLEFSLDMENMISNGANIIGGCCGTTPEYIRQLALFKKRPLRL